MSNTAQAEDVLAFVARRVAVFTKQDASSITEDSVLVDIGLQSIDAVLLCGEVEDNYGVEIDPAMIFDHDTLGSFVVAVRALVHA